jgi:hypothetical protein
MTKERMQTPSEDSGQESSALVAQASAPRFSSRTHRTLFITLFLLTVLFSAVDLVSTSVALSRGLAEANSIMIALASMTGLGLVGALGITKLVFLSGSAFVAVLGIRTSNSGLRTRALIVSGFLVVMLFGVAMNNLYWISTSL